jgi:hypothetical protein
MWEFFDKLIAHLAPNPWVQMSGWMFSLLPLLGWLVSRRPRRQPTYAIDKRVIFEDLGKVHPDLSISFRQDPVPNLALTTIRIWNEGRIAIRSQDVSTHDPLSIVVPNDVTQLHIEVTATSGPAGGFSLGGTIDGVTPIVFEVMDNLQGCEVAILHTLGSGGYLKVRGTFIESAPLMAHDSGWWRRRFWLLAFIVIAVPVGWIFQLGSGYTVICMVVAVALVFADLFDRRLFRDQKLFKRSPYTGLGEWSRTRGPTM